MDQPGAQQIFFQHIKSNLAAHLSLVDEVADLLSISNDSAYRRIRGEKPLSFEEIKSLCTHYRISLDQLFHLNNDSFLFSGPLVNKEKFDIQKWLDYLLKQLIYINTFEHRELFYSAKDIYIFHCFAYHELVVFKIFFWMKTILQYPITGKELYVLDGLRESVHKIASRNNEEFNKIPCQEIWGVETIDSLISQIEYFRQSELFKSSQYAKDIYQILFKMIDHLEAQAEAGYKFPVGGKPSAASAPYKLYINEFIVGDNSNLAILNNNKVLYLNHSVLNIVVTKDPVFTEYTYQHFQNIISKSTLISGVGEKERRRFFNSLREKVDARLSIL